MSRYDGKRVTDAELMYLFVPYIMPRRYDAQNMITIDIPVDPMHEYINAKRKENVFFSHMTLLLAAYVQVVAEYPLLNRFVNNKLIYDRYNLDVAFVIMRPGDSDSTISKLRFEKTDTIYDVQRKMDEFIKENNEASSSNSTDRLMEGLKRFPWVMRIGVPFLMWLDKHNMMPKAVVDASPFHVSMTISNLASIRTNHIYHHCYDFGTTSIFITMGNMREVPKREKGEIVFRRCMPLGVVMDERIASGYYFARSFAKFSQYLAHPELLEQPFTGEQVLK